MGLAQQIVGGTSGNLAEVDSYKQLNVAMPKTEAQSGIVRNYSLHDEGFLTAVPVLRPPETDCDYRLRVAQDVLLDDELFNYTAQNTGKHTILAAAVNLAPSWTISGYQTNPTSIVATTSGATFQSYACFPAVGTATLSCEMEVSFTAQPTTNTIIDFGLFTGAITNPFAPTDGAYFRLNSAGLLGVVNYNGNETPTGVFPLLNGAGAWQYTNNRKYQFILYVTTREVQFWVNDPTNTQGACLLGTLPCPETQGTPYMSTSQPWHIRHAIAGGAAGAALNCIVTRYSVRLGGVGIPDTLGSIGSRALGTYQGLSGGTMGSLMFGTVTTGSVVPPTAAQATNTSAALGVGMGGMYYETVTTLCATDAIISSYQVPAGTANIQGRRMKVSGVGVGSWVQTAVVGGPINARFYIAFGHTAVSLATAEAATTKAPRRVMTPIIQTITATQAINTIVAQNTPQYTFVNPIYVNPGEFIQLVRTCYGTTLTAPGVLAHNVSWDYTWE